MAIYKFKGLLTLLALCIVFQFIVFNRMLTHSATNVKRGTHTKWEQCYQRNESSSQLKSKAFRLMLQNSKQALQSDLSDETEIQHYQFSKYQLSMNHGSGFDFEYVNAKNQGLHWSSSMEENDMREISHCQGKERIICQIDMTLSPLTRHFPHFAQIAFPCFSALQIAKDKLSLYSQKSNKRTFQLQVILNDRGAVKNTINSLIRNYDVSAKKWAQGFYTAAKESGLEVEFVAIGDSESLNIDGSCNWIAQIPPSIASEDKSGWPDEINAPDIQGYDIDLYPVGNAKWFTRRRDMDIFQQHVLGKEFQFGPSHDLPFKVMINNRESKTRHWVYAEETKAMLETTWNTKNNDILDINIISNLVGNMQNQAQIIHNADIIIASHGAALTNLAFIRPCTAVLELFPYAYYIGFFQPFVLTGEGISYEGYHYDGTKVVESTGRDGQFRNVPLVTSPESILNIFPTILMEVLTCRENWSPSEQSQQSFYNT